MRMTLAQKESGTDDTLEAILRDPRRKAVMHQRIGLDDPRPSRQAPDDSCLTTPSEMTTDSWSYLPAPFGALLPYVGPYGYSSFPDWRHTEQARRIFYHTSSDVDLHKNTCV